MKKVKKPAIDHEDFFASIEDLKKQGVPEEEVLQTLTTALTNAYKRTTGDYGDIEIVLDKDKRKVKFYNVKYVVEEVNNFDNEISLEEVHDLNKDYKIGDVIREEVSPLSFSRISASNTRQMVGQKIRQVERDTAISEFENKQGELMACTVRKIDGDTIYVELAGSNLEGVLLKKDQVPTEKYEVNQKLNVFVKHVNDAGKNAQVMVSRSASGLVEKLFENEVPEIAQGIVKVMSVAREAGQRTKIAIYSEDANVDAVGSCVGNKGSRVNAVVAELNGEKIDIIPYSENPAEFIYNALSPAKAVKVTILNENDRTARAIVPDDKLSLAIGRNGQNARLAVRLTGWKIDIKSVSQSGETDLEEQPSEEEPKAE